VASLASIRQVAVQDLLPGVDENCMEIIRNRHFPQQEIFAHLFTLISQLFFINQKLN
jgi:hypothetical protein